MADNMPSESEFRAGRTDSTSSTSTTGSAAKAPSQPTRRPSHGLFDSLEAQKRKDDPASIARRQSMNEQRPAPGFIGKMWNNWVHGKE